MAPLLIQLSAMEMHLEKHNDRSLCHCRLCNHFLTSKGCKKGDKCIFAHSLGALRPAPREWSHATHHYWEKGDPMPSAEVRDLIEKYIEYEKLPLWLFRAQVHPAFHGQPPRRLEAEGTDQVPACKKARPTPKEPTPKEPPFLPPAATSSPMPPLVPKHTNTGTAQGNDAGA